MPSIIKFCIYSVTITLSLSILLEGTLSAHGQSNSITGEYRINKGNCVGKASASPCEIYFELHGKIAQALYENMRSKAGDELCTGGRVKLDRDALRCFKTGAAEYVCDVGYSFAKQKFIGGDMTC